MKKLLFIFCSAFFSLYVTNYAYAYVYHNAQETIISHIKGNNIFDDNLANYDTDAELNAVKKKFDVIINQYKLGNYEGIYENIEEFMELLKSHELDSEALTEFQFHMIAAHTAYQQGSYNKALDHLRIIIKKDQRYYELNEELQDVFADMYYRILSTYKNIDEVLDFLYIHVMTNVFLNKKTYVLKYGIYLTEMLMMNKELSKSLKTVESLLSYFDFSSRYKNYETSMSSIIEEKNPKLFIILAYYSNILEDPKYMQQFFIGAVQKAFADKDINFLIFILEQGILSLNSNELYTKSNKLGKIFLKRAKRIKDKLRLLNTYIIFGYNLYYKKEYKKSYKWFRKAQRLNKNSSSDQIALIIEQLLLLSSSKFDQKLASQHEISVGNLKANISKDS